MGFAPLTAYCLLTLIWVQNVRPVALWEQCMWSLALLLSVSNIT